MIRKPPARPPVAARRRGLVPARRRLLRRPAGLAAAPAHAGKTLDAVKQRGSVNCGVTTGVAGFSAPDSQGHWSGLDVDTCRAIAAAVLGDAKKVNFVPLNSQQRFASLQAGEIDVLARNTTWTLTRDASLGFNFTAITYYDGQGFLVPKKLKVTSPKQLKGADDLHPERHHQREERRRLLPRAEREGQDRRLRRLRGVVQGLLRRPLPGLHHRRLGARRAAQQGGEEPRRLRHPARADLQGAARPGRCAAATTSGSPIVKWTIYALIEAEENGLTQANVDDPQGRQQRPGRAAPARQLAKTSASCSASTRTGPTAPSRRSATTARSSSATSARSRCSSCRAAPTTCGARAA